jgi:hypothetical protein
LPLPRRWKTKVYNGGTISINMAPLRGLGGAKKRNLY